MTDVHGEEEYFDTRFLNSLPDGSIFLDGEESKKKKLTALFIQSSLVIHHLASLRTL